MTCPVQNRSFSCTFRLEGREVQLQTAVKYTLFYFLFLSPQLCFSQSLALETDQSYSNYVTTNNDNGSVLVLQNRTRQLLGNPVTDQINFGKIDFVDSLGFTVGQMAYRSEQIQQFDDPVTKFHTLPFQVNSSNVLNIYNRTCGETVGEYLITSTGAYCTVGGVWENTLASKKFETKLEVNVDHMSLLNRLPVYQWSYKSNPGENHIGPTAEDFHNTFEVGSSSEKLAAIDVHGVSLNALKLLYRKILALEDELTGLQDKITRLR